jgi:competence protein ComEC
VACVGVANRFGFPDPSVVERWRAAGAEFHRTDEGAVRFLSDGARLRQVAAGGAVDLATLLSEAP